jgi:molybdopterin converting factor small subunit
MRVLVTTMGPLRRIVAIDDEVVEVANGATVAEAVEALVARHAGLAPHRNSILAAIDEEWSAMDATLTPNARLILMPPVSGG